MSILSNDCRRWLHKWNSRVNSYSRSGLDFSSIWDLHRFDDRYANNKLVFPVHTCIARIGKKKIVG